MKTSSTIHDSANLTCWGSANVEEWKLMDPDTMQYPHEIDLGPGHIGRLPLLIKNLVEVDNE